MNVSSDGRWIVCGCEDGNVRVYNLEYHEFMFELVEHQGVIFLFYINLASKCCFFLVRF